MQLHMFWEQKHFIPFANFNFGADFGDEENRISIS